jgi:transcriptional regulator with XRE-family HTH domain
MAIVNFPDPSPIATLRYRVGAKIRKARQMQGLTLDQLGPRCGTSAQSIQRIETGTMTLSVDRLGQICEALELEPATLFADETFTEYKQAARVKTDTQALQVYVADFLETLATFNAKFERSE